ncbi:MAG: hypothetical protein ACKPKG_15690, partial [Dolichospermum sp.]
LTDVMRYKVTPPPTPSPLFERGLNMYLIRAETPVNLVYLPNILSRVPELYNPKMVKSCGVGILPARLIQIKYTTAYQSMIYLNLSQYQGAG